MAEIANPDPTSPAYTWLIGQKPSSLPFTLGTVHFVLGVPPTALGANGDFAFRFDGTAGACIYQRRAGAWVATGA